MLELFTLKKSYDSVRQELAHALYANDSANRVVARLMWERDEARAALASIKESLGQNGTAGSGAAGAGQEDAEMSDAATGSQGLPKTALAKVDETSKALSSTRRTKLKRKPEGYAQAGDVARFGQAESLPSMHGTKPPGVTSLDVSLNGSLILTGGRDKQVQVYNKSTGKIAATLKGHTKEVTRVAFAQSSVGLEHGNVSADKAGVPPPFAISASADHSVRVWRAAEEGKNAYALSHTVNDFKDTVSGLAAHPCGDYFVASSNDGSWAVYDLTSGSRLLHVQTAHQFASLDVHPDGVLLAAGTTAGTVIIYDLRTGQESATFASDAAGSSVSSLSFSENGYLLASATATQVEIWDLRKLSKSGTIAVEGDGSVTTSVRFDPSAQFLAVVGADVRVYANKTWELLFKAEEGHSAPATDVKWQWSDGALITAGLDRTVRTFAVMAA